MLLKVVPLPAHASHLLQPLDLGLFGTQKAKKSAIIAPRKFSAQSAELIRIMNSFYAAFTPTTIVSAFRQVGIVTHYSTATGQTSVQIIRSAARNLPHIAHVPYQAPSVQVHLPGRRNGARANFPTPRGITVAPTPVRVLVNTARLTLEAERVDAGVQGAEQEQAPLTDSPEQLRTADGAIPGPLRQQRHTVTQVDAREHQRFLGRNLTGSDIADIEFTSTARETQRYYDAAVVTTSDEVPVTETPTTQLNGRLSILWSERANRPSARVRKRLELFGQRTARELALLEEQINEGIG